MSLFSLVCLLIFNMICIAISACFVDIIFVKAKQKKNDDTEIHISSFTCTHTYTYIGPDTHTHSHMSNINNYKVCNEYTSRNRNE